MSIVRGIFRFCYDFIVGDDWKIAAAVVTALGASLALLSTSAVSDTAVLVTGAGLLISAFCAALWIDTRSLARR